MTFITRGLSTVLALLAVLFLVSCGGEPDAKLETGTSLSMVLGTHQATLPPGTGYQNAISLNWVGCPPRPVTLDVAGLPAGVTATFSANPALTASDLRLSVGATVPKGAYTFQVRGASDNLLQTQPFTLVVDSAAPAFTAAFSPSTLVLDPVLPASTTATITRTGGLTAPITITATLPPGVTYTVASPRVVGTAPAAETYTITFQGSGSVAPGAYIAQVNLTAAGVLVTQNIPFTVVPLPTARLTAAATIVTTGTAATLTPTFTGGTAAITGLPGPFASGTAVGTGALAGPATFTLTVTNAAGSTASSSVSIATVAPPAISGFTAGASPITAGGSTSLTATFAGGTATVDHGVGAVVSGTPASTGALATTTTFTLTVTNAAGLAVTASRTVTVVAAPVITGFTSSPCAVPLGTGATLTPTFTVDAGGSATITSVAGPVVTGGSYAVTPAAVGPASYTLTVTNGAGTSLSQALTVQVSGFVASGTLAAGRQRQHHDAARLPDGRVLLVGGQDILGSGIAQTSIFDPAAGAFADHALLGTARIYPTATVLRSGQVLVVGGTTSLTAGPALATAEVVDGVAGTSTPVTGSFSSTLAEGRYLHTATLLGNGKVLLVGGYTNTAQGTAIALGAELYDSSNGFTPFQATGSLTTPRAAHAAVLLPDGRVMVIGGWTGVGAAGQTEIYDPSTGSWSAGPALAVAVSDAAATLLKDGRILVTGGNSNGSPLATAQVIDAGLTTCVNLFPVQMTTSRAQHRSTLLADGRVLITGGSTPTNQAELFDPATNTFAATPLQLERRSGHTATLLANGRVLLASGENPGAASPIYSTTGEAYVPGACTTQMLVEPQGINLRVGDAYPFQATVDTPAVNKAVGWSIQEGAPAGGTLASVLGNAVTYTTPGTSGTRHLVATSTGDPAGSASTVIKSGPVTISMNLTSHKQPVNRTTTFALFVSVKGAVDTRYTLSTDEPGGAFYDGDGGFYRSAGVPGVYHARATSVADPTVFVEALVDVTANPLISAFTLANAGANWQLGQSWTLDSRVILTSATVTRRPSNAVINPVVSGGTEVLGSTLPDDGFLLTVNDSAGGQSLAYVAAPAFTFGITPTTSTLLVGDTLTFTTVEGGVSQSYGATWTVQEAGGGTIGANGTYTAPGVAGTYHVIGTSKLNPAFTATATLTVRPRLVILPGPGTLGPSSSRILRHALAGLPDHRVTWSVASAPAYTGLYGLPATVTSAGVFSGTNAEPGRYTIQATSLVDATVTGTVIIQVVNNRAGDGVYQAPNTPAQPIYGGRYDHALVSLQDGRVLVVGGRSTPNGVADLGYGEVYAPANPAFSGTSFPLNWGPRRNHCATLLPTGKVLITGGFAYNGIVEYVSAYPELYDPATNQFQYSNSTMITARYGHRAELLPNGNVLVVGGYDSTGAPLASAELYDPYTDTWTDLGAMPQGVRTRHAMTRLLDNRILVAGGSATGADSGITATGAVFTASLTDIHAGTWSATGALAQGVADAGCALTPGGKVVLAGGTAWSGTAAVVSGGLQVYDPIGGTFAATATALPKARTRPLVALGLDNLVHVLGGHDGTATTTSHFQYNLQTDAFVAPSGSLMIARDAVSSWLLLTGPGGLMVFGMDNQTTVAPFHHLEYLPFYVPLP